MSFFLFFLSCKKLFSIYILLLAFLVHEFTNESGDSDFDYFLRIGEIGNFSLEYLNLLFSENN